MESGCCDLEGRFFSMAHASVVIDCISLKPVNFTMKFTCVLLGASRDKIKLLVIELSAWSPTDSFCECSASVIDRLTKDSTLI